MSQDYLDKLIEKDKAGTQIQSIPLHDTELRGITIDDPITVEGNPINFSTKNEQNAIQTVVNLEPIQDLHGYSKPWVGGAGKNIAPITVADLKAANTAGTWNGNTYTLFETTFTLVTDKDNNVIGIKINSVSTADGNRDFRIGGAYGTTNLFAPSGTYTLSLEGANSSIVGLGGYGNNVILNNTIMTTGSCPDGVSWFLVRLNQGANVSNVIVKPMLRLSTVSDSTFEPYTNICPIFPHEEIKIGGCGKNLAELENGTIDGNTGEKTIGVYPRVRLEHFIKIKANTPYKLICQTTKTSKTLNTEVSNWMYDSFGNNTRTYVSGWMSENQYNLQYTTDKNLYLLFRYSDNSEIDLSELSVQLEEGSFTTEYEPYQESNSLTLPLLEDVYGGTLNLETGEMVVDRGYVEFDGSSDENWGLSSAAAKRVDTGYLIPVIKKVNANVKANIISNQYYKETSNKTYSGTIGISVDTSGYLAVADGTNSMSVSGWINSLISNPLQVVYELATPYTLQLTPSQLKLFKDVNNLNSSDYTTLTVTYHSNSIATLAPATDTTDGLLSAMDKHKLNTYDIADIGSDEGVTVEDNPLMITTRSDQHALSTKVSLAPIQDLHGYSKPWVGGAGKNLLPMTVEGIKAANSEATWTGNSTVLRGITFTILTDEDSNVTGIKANGTSTANNAQLNIKQSIGLSSGTYILNGAISSTKRIFFYDGTSWYDDYGSGKSFTISSQTTQAVTITIATSGTTVNNEVFYPMIRLSTESNPTFEPYTNICSISGLDEIDILGCGVNLIKYWEQGAYNGSTGLPMSSNKYVRTNKIVINPNIQYVLSKVIQNSGNILYWDRYDNFISSDNIDWQVYTVNINAPSNTRYIAFNIYDNTAISPSTVGNIQLEVGNQPTDYSPYQESNNLSLSLPETVYGGELDLENGEMRVDKKIIADMSTLTWQRITTNVFKATYSGIKYCGDAETANIFCEIYAPGNYQGLANGTIAVRRDNEFWVRDATSNDDGTTFVNIITGHKICYELATPYTLQLTPEQLTLFKDINHISTNAKSISVTYREGKLAINSPATDTKDGLLTAMDKRALDRTEEIIEGNPIAFETESAQVAKSTIVDLEPIQDLHGYSKPWVGGAGKNKLGGVFATITSSNVEFVANSDGTVTAKNTSNGYAYINSSAFDIKAGTYTFSGCPSGNNKYILALYENNAVYSQISNGATVTITIESDTTLVARCVINGADVPTNVTFKPQLELGSTATSYEPYENICPISGRSEVDILGCGKNLISGYQANRCINGSGQIASDGSTCISNYICLKDNVNYTLAYTKSASSVVAHCFDEYGNYLSYVALGTTNPVTFSTNNLKNGTKNIYIQWNEAGGGSILPTNGQLEISSLATEYSPYIESTSLQIQLGQTIYGGQLDVENGVLVVDREMKVYDGTNYTPTDHYTGNIYMNIENTAKYKPSNEDLCMSCNCAKWVANDITTRGSYCYNGSNGAYFTKNSTFASASDFAAYALNNNIQMVIPILTPIIISLTPEQVKLLQGVNTITTNADNITLTYRNGSVATLNDLESLYAKLKAYIDSLHSS